MQRAARPARQLSSRSTLSMSAGRLPAIRRAAARRVARAARGTVAGNAASSSADAPRACHRRIERRIAGQQLVQHRAKAVDVIGDAGGRARGLLRTHAVRRAAAGVGGGLRSDDERHAEIGELRRAVGRRAGRSPASRRDGRCPRDARAPAPLRSATPRAERSRDELRPRSCDRSPPDAYSIAIHACRAERYSPSTRRMFG